MTSKGCGAFSDVAREIRQHAVGMVGVIHRCCLGSDGHSR
jgi:hypothetical protein